MWHDATGILIKNLVTDFEKILSVLIRDGKRTDGTALRFCPGPVCPAGQLCVTVPRNFVTVPRNRKSDGTEKK